MAYKVNTLVMKKKHDSDTVGLVNSVDEFGIYVAESMPEMDPAEVKTEGDSQDWPDEDGLDVLDFERSYISAFEVDIPFVCYASTTEACRKAYRAFLNYLTGRPYVNKSGISRVPVGTMMMLYQPWVGYGRKDVRYKGTSDKEFWRDTTGQTIYTFTVRVEVCDPTSVVVLNSTPDLVVDSSIDLSPNDMNKVFFGSSLDVPDFIDRSKGSATIPTSTTSTTKTVTTTVQSMHKCHWILIPTDSRYSVTSVRLGNETLPSGYIQTRYIDGYTLTYILSTDYIVGTTTFVISR